MGRTTAKSLLLLKKYADSALEGGFNGAYVALAREEQQRLDRLRPEDWVDYGFFFRLLEAVARAADAEPLQFCESFGVFQAEHDTRLLHRTALRLGGPGIMIMEADQIWRRYHDTGHLRLFDLLPTTARARVEGLDGGGPLLCAVVQGFISTALTLTGARGVKVEHVKCRFRGDEVCEYNGIWEKGQGRGRTAGAGIGVQGGGP